MKILVTSSVFCILIIAICSVKAQFVSQPIDEDTISLGGLATRVKRAANLNSINQFFRALGNAFEKIHGRPRQHASLGTFNDLPTVIKAGGTKFKPRIQNSLLDQAEKAKFRTIKDGRQINNPYTTRVKKQPSGHRYKEGLRKKDAPGCGAPLCTIVDMRIKSFKSMCHLTEWMTEKAKYRQVFEIQKGSCENAIKYPTKGKWLRSKWIPSRRNRRKLQKRNGCNKCRKNKECNKKVCVNDNGHAKSFGNICEAHKYLMKQPKSLKLVSFALGDCKELYSQCLYTEWWDLDDPSDKGEHEGVAQVFNHLSDYSDKHVHRSCSMNRIHYPVEIQTTQDQRDVQGGQYTKRPHDITCHNKPGKVMKPQAPYYWDAQNVTCRDWKLRYCCENLWGEPSLYATALQGAREEAKKEGKKLKGIRKPISKDSDVMIDAPTRKNLFEDCEWRSFMSISVFQGSDIDPMYSHFGTNTRDLCGRGRKTKSIEKGNALYIDARTVDKGQKPWDETSDFISKVSPLYGVYCEKKNNGVRCQDYKYRLCCKKNDKTKSYGKWGKWGACMGDCKKDQGEQTRTRDCLKLKDGSYRPNCEFEGEEEGGKEKWVVSDKNECTRTDPECRKTVTWNPWEAWTTCSVTCGEGERRRRRYCLKGQRMRTGRQGRSRKSSFKICGPDGVLIEVGKCRSGNPCHDYAFEKWTPWSKCDAATCGSGTRTRSRICIDKGYGRTEVANSFCSSSPSSALIVQNCVNKDNDKCKRDGGWSEWRPWPTPDPNNEDEWGRCDASCGEGMKKSKRFCDNPAPAGGGAECNGEEIKETSCLAIDKDGKDILCPHNCVMSVWGQWSGCLSSCVDHYDDFKTSMVKRRHIIQEAKNGGRECYGKLEQIQECTVCRKTLWPGTKEKGRNPCVARCPVDCELHPWTPWTSYCKCPSKAKPGRKQRTRAVKTLAEYGGKPCLDLDMKPMPEDMYSETEKVVCTKADRQRKCPYDPVGPQGRPYTLWGEWGACTSPCNGNRMGKKTRTRICLKKRGCRKKETYQTQKCESTCNPEVWRDWSMWEPCSVTCGKGKQIRKRSCIRSRNRDSKAYCKKVTKIEGRRENRVCDYGPCGKAENPKDLYGKMSSGGYESEEITY